MHSTLLYPMLGCIMVLGSVCEVLERDLVSYMLYLYVFADQHED